MHRSGSAAPAPFRNVSGVPGTFVSLTGTFWPARLTGFSSITTCTLLP